MLDQYESALSNCFDINRGQEGYDLADDRDLAGMTMASMMPLLILIFLFSGCMAVAPESIAGEKERGTIATILVTPIRRSDTLFFDTLYDENASCHLALGMGFPECVSGGVSMSKEALLEHGVNQSAAHVDFMIGTDDLCVTGICEDGTEVPVFVNGQWAWE